MDITKFLESKETYDKVVKVLSEKAGLPVAQISSTINKTGESLNPPEGFIAGGSVSNIIYSLLHGGKPAINDIDIFYFFDNKNGDWISPKLDEFPVPLETDIKTGGDDYGNKWVQPNGEFSIMRSHSRQGIFNYIQVYVGSNTYQRDLINNPINKPLILLKSFDLNCCQAGLDIQNGKIVYTKKFTEFLRSRQLQVTIPISPIQTTIRLIKKMEDLNCYCDLDSEIKLLQHSMFTGSIAYTFGVETYEKYLKYSEIIDKYFKIIDYKPSTLFNDFNLDSEENKKHETKNSGLRAFDVVLDKYELEYSFSHPLALMNYWRISKGTLSQSKLKKFNIIKDVVYRSGVRPITSHGFSSLRNHDNKHVSVVKLNSSGIHPENLDNFVKLTKTEVHSISHWVWNSLLVNEGYYDCDFHEKHIYYIDRLLKEHHGLERLIDHLGDDLTLQKHYRFLKTITKIAKKRGEWVIGELENLHGDRLIEFSKSGGSEEWLNTFFDTLEKELSIDLVEPVDLTGFEYIDCVKELTTTIALRTEGVKMGHCVGGYSSNVKDGRSRIFHIECDGIGSTLEVGGVNSGYNVWDSHNFTTTGHDNEDDEEIKKLNRDLLKVQYRKIQHYGRYPKKGNIIPTDINIGIAEDLIDFINSSGTVKEGVLEVLWKQHLLTKKIDKKKRDKKKDVILEKERALHGPNTEIGCFIL